MSKNKKVAIYGVCKNEEKNIHKWYEHAKDADYILLLDTGSIDNTVEIAKSLGINVHIASIDPWSETLAKNIAMSLLPKDIDICICLDLDQIILNEDWKNIIRKAEKFDIGLFNYLVPNGYKDDVEKQEIPVAHSRNNVVWFGYRPKLRYIDIESKDYKMHNMDIDVYHMHGDIDRFNDREQLYVRSFLLEEQHTKMYSDKSYYFSVLCHIALSYFEYGDYEKFDNYYKKAIDLYNADLKGLDFLLEYRPFSFLQLAKFLLLKDGHEEFLIECLNNKHFSEVKTTFFIRLLIVKYLKYRSFQNDINIKVPENRIDLLKKVSDLNYFEISYFLSNIEWGKSHKELAEKVIGYIDCGK